MLHVPDDHASLPETRAVGPDLHRQSPAIGREDQSIRFAGHLDPGRFDPGSGVPDRPLLRMGRSDGEELPFRTEGQGGERVRLGPGRPAHDPAGRNLGGCDVPEDAPASLECQPGGHHGLAVGGQPEVAGNAGLGVEQAVYPAGRGVPDPELAVVAIGDEMLAIGGIGDSVDGRALAVPGGPQPHRGTVGERVAEAVDLRGRGRGSRSGGLRDGRSPGRRSALPDHPGRHGQEVCGDHAQPQVCGLCEDHPARDAARQRGGRPRAGRGTSGGREGRVECSPGQAVGQDGRRWEEAGLGSGEDGQGARSGPAAGQPSGEGGAGLGDPGLERPQRPAQRPRGGLVAQPLHQAQHGRRLLLLGQAQDLVIDHRPEFPAGHLVRRIRTGRSGGLRATAVEQPHMSLPPAAGRRSRVPGDTVRDAVEPLGHGLAVAQAARLANEDEEGGLERVLDLLRVVEPSAADGQDHRPVSGDQFLEGRFVPAADEPLEQLALIQAGEGAAGEQGAELGHEGPGSQHGHPSRSVCGRLSPSILPARPRVDGPFLELAVLCFAGTSDGAREARLRSRHCRAPGASARIRGAGGTWGDAWRRDSLGKSNCSDRSFLLG